MIDVNGEVLRDRFRGCMIGLAVGDALGMPVETLTPEEILAATDGDGVCGYLAPLQARFHSTALLAPGQWTDDTQLSLAIARSIVRKGKVDLDDIVAEHVVEYHRERRGWGRSTTRAVAEFADGVRKAGEPVRDPEAQGLGNGVAMKVAPLALTMLGNNIGTATLAVFALANLTHRDVCAASGAAMVAAAIRQAAILVGGDPVFMICQTSLMAGGGVRCPEHGDPVFDACSVAVGTDAERIAQEILTRTKCDVRESVPFVFATVREHLLGGSFRTGVLAAVNVGGDTDSNGAMVGAILGAFHGLSAIPQEWVDGLEAHDEIIAIADQLFELVTLQ